MRQFVYSVHRRRRSSTILGDLLPSTLFPEIIRFWAESISFLSGLSSQYCMVRSSYWKKYFRIYRNRLTLLATQSMTCPSSLNTRPFKHKHTKKSFLDQALSTDMFISLVRRLQQNLGSPLTEPTIPSFGRLDILTKWAWGGGHDLYGLFAHQNRVGTEPRQQCSSGRQ